MVLVADADLRLERRENPILFIEMRANPSELSIHARWARFQGRPENKLCNALAQLGPSVANHARYSRSPCGGLWDRHRIARSANPCDE